MAVQNLFHSGAPLETARAAAVLVHGRGSTAQNILTLASELEDESTAFLAPQAPGNVWYPYSFLSPIEQNEPHLTNALKTLSEVMATLASAGLPPERTLLLGFSQGACLALEWAARSPAADSPDAGSRRRYGGIAGLSGGLIGPPGTEFAYPGSLDGTPVFLGCSDIDPHIPRERVEDTARAFEALGAVVTTRIYPGMGHTINEDELAFVRQMLSDISR